MNVYIVPEDQRSWFLQSNFKDTLFDLSVFHIADNIYPGYTGGFWQYATVTIGDNDSAPAPFLFPSVEGNIKLVNPFTGVECEVDAVLGGMIVTLYTLNWLIEQNPNNDNYQGLYYLLRDAVSERCSTTGRTDAWMKLVDWYCHGRRTAALFYGFALINVIVGYLRVK